MYGWFWAMKMSNPNLRPEVGLTQGRALVADSVRLGEVLVAQQGRLGHGPEDQVPVLDVRLVDVHDLTGAEQGRLRRGAADAVQLAGDVGQELVDLGRQDLVDPAGDAQHRGVEVLGDQVLEGQRLVAVLDDERGVEVLVQHDGHARGGRGLDRDAVSRGLPHGDELTGLAGVDHVAVGRDQRLEVAVHQVPEDHVLLEDRDALIGPQFGNVGVGVTRAVTVPSKTEVKGEASSRLKGFISGPLAGKVH